MKIRTRFFVFSSALLLITAISLSAAFYALLEPFRLQQAMGGIAEASMLATLSPIGSGERATALVTILLATFAALLGTVVALNRWISDSMLTPLERLTESIVAIGAGRLDVIVPNSHRTDEVGILARGVQNMTGKIKSNFAELSSAAKFVALSEMATGITHETNNPLTVIMGKALILERQKGAEYVHDSASKIIEMVTRITNTLSAFRVYARPRTDDVIGAASIQSIVDSTLGICAERFRLASIRVEVSVKPADSTIIARANQISQILMNLLNNAYDALTIPAVPLKNDEKWIRIEAVENEWAVTVAVENGGPKISPQVIAHIFEPFFSTKPRSDGTGIGLAISRRLAEANDAKLYLDTKSPHTRFALEFARPEEV